MQPSILPWGGFFALAASVENFVILDNVQYCKGTSHSRFFLNHDGKKVTYSVPVYHKSVASKQIKDIQIRTELFPRQMIARLEQQYSKITPSAQSVLSRVITCLMADHSYLATMNVDLAHIVFDELNINPRIHFASNLLGEKIYEDPITRLITIVKHLGCEHYLMPSRSLEYALPEIGRFHDEQIKTSTVHYDQAPYKHKSMTFIPNLSILDILLNEEREFWHQRLRSSFSLSCIG